MSCPDSTSLMYAAGNGLERVRTRPGRQGRGAEEGAIRLVAPEAALKCIPEKKRVSECAREDRGGVLAGPFAPAANVVEPLPRGIEHRDASAPIVHHRNSTARQNCEVGDEIENLAFVSVHARRADPNVRRPKSKGVRRRTKYMHDSDPGAVIVLNGRSYVASGLACCVNRSAKYRRYPNRRIAANPRRTGAMNQFRWSSSR